MYSLVSWPALCLYFDLPYYLNNFLLRDMIKVISEVATVMLFLAFHMLHNLDTGHLPLYKA